jgi:hypothetical protein
MFQMRSMTLIESCLLRELEVTGFTGRHEACGLGLVNNPCPSFDNFHKQTNRSSLKHVGPLSIRNYYVSFLLFGSALSLRCSFLYAVCLIKLHVANAQFRSIRSLPSVRRMCLQPSGSRDAVARATQVRPCPSTRPRIRLNKPSSRPLL